MITGALISQLNSSDENHERSSFRQRSLLTPVALFINEPVDAENFPGNPRDLCGSKVSTCDLVRIGGENVKHVKQRRIAEGELADIWFNQWDVQTV